MKFFGFPSLSASSAVAILAIGLAALAVSSCDQTPAGPAKIAYGTKIDFGQNGNASAIKASGWNPAEEKFTWSDGNTAALTVNAPATDRPVTLKVRMSALFNAPALAAQPVAVLVNGTKIADWQVSEIDTFTAPIPENLTKAGSALTIKFDLPKATTPKAIGKGDDSRTLGICVYDLELSTS